MEQQSQSVDHRTKAHPLGLPGLQGRAKEAVEDANMILDRVFALCDVAVQHHVMVSIENPASSTLWHTPQFCQWAANSRASCVTVHYCRYGCNYVKPTKFVITSSMFTSLGLKCTHDANQHDRLSGWRDLKKPEQHCIPTAACAAYPPQFCDQWASHVKRVLEGYEVDTD